jgi:predicted dehydrogenase
MNPKQVAVIGCGAVFETFYSNALRNLEKSALIKVRLLVDPEPRNLTNAGRAFPHSTQAQSFDQSPRALKLDCALVLTPPATHCGILLRLAETGISVYCEKPLTTSVAEAEQIAAAFKKQGVECKVGYVRRLFPNFQVLRKIFSVMGPKREIALSDGEVFRWPIKTSGVFLPGNAGAGVVWDKLSHNLDLIHWVAGLKEVTKVESSCQPGCVPADILVEGMTNFGHFRAAVSWTTALPNMISLADGSSRAECQNGLSSNIRMSSALAGSEEPVKRAPRNYGEALQFALEAFFEGRKDGAGSLLATADESIVLTKFLTTINAKARQVN